MVVVGLEDELAAELQNAGVPGSSQLSKLTVTEGRVKVIELRVVECVE